MIGSLIGKIVTTPNIGWPSESWNADLIDPRIGCLAKPKDVVRWMSNVGMENLRWKGDIGPGILRHRPITGSTLNPNVVHPSCQPEKISQFQSHWYHHKKSSRELSAFNPMIITWNIHPLPSRFPSCYGSPRTFALPPPLYDHHIFLSDHFMMISHRIRQQRCRGWWRWS